MAKDPDPFPSIRGRATVTNPPTRFDPLYYEEDPESIAESDPRRVSTEFFEDHTRSIVARNDSPDIPFTFSINPYRGCEHGCIYCYARPSHEYLGFSAGLDFETRILVKRDAPALLEAFFNRPSWKPESITLSGNTDPYQPVERNLRLTRGCLEVFLRYRNPVSIITKNHLVTRDLDLLHDLAAMNLICVIISITSLRPEITGKMEPRTARPALRLKTIEELARRGIPVGVNVAPIVPGLTDSEVAPILAEAARCGATMAHYQILRLPGAVRDLFLDWLQREYPDSAAKVVHRLQEMRGPDLQENRFVHRMRGKGKTAEMIDALFRVSCIKHGLNRKRTELATNLFRRPQGNQTELF